MSILGRLSSQRGERDNVADIALAEDIIKTKNKKAVAELVEYLQDKNKRLASDCIKTLYEIGEREPKLIAPYVDEFAALLTSKTQRHVWGGVTALNMCATADPEAVYVHLKAILKAAEGESVIARDHAVHILRKLCAAGHNKQCFPILLAIIARAPVNQWPTYAEQAGEEATGTQRAKLAEIVMSRMSSIVEHNTKTKRMQKLLKKLA